jgi:3-phosphoshikimate 1-carboxyvinyltransferase
VSKPTDRIEIQPVPNPVRGTIRPPGSKSITNRALVCAALAIGESTLEGALDSEDTRVMVEGLKQLGLAVAVHEGGTRLVVPGRGGRLPASSADIFVGNSGTTIRFLTALCALGHGGYRLDGVARMRERPIGDLLTALNELGADCRGALRDGFPPVEVRGRGLAGGRANVRGNISSQFLSALMMAIPYAESPAELVVSGELVSRPYVEMTLRVMQSFGVTLETEQLAVFRAAGKQQYQSCRYEIEPDASAASYFWAAAAITGGEVTVEGLTQDALQGDVKFVECLKQMGCQVRNGAAGITVSGRAARGIDVDMNAISDTVQTLAPVALFAEGPTTIRGVGHIRHKETDRIGDLARELRKFGATVEETADGLRIEPPPAGQIRGATVETYHDHRMAMSLALPGLVVPGVVVLDPGCTAKTYPGYFDDLARLVGAAEAPMTKHQ